MAQNKQPAKKQASSKPGSPESSVRSDADKAAGKSKTGKTTPGTQEQQPSKKSRGCLLKLILFAVLLAVLIGGMFAAAYYLGFINVKEIKEEIGQKYQLHQYPVIGQYFSEVDTNFETVPLEEPSSEQTPPQPPPQDQAQPVLPPQTIGKQNSNILTPEDVAREEKKREDEAVKRISRTARLYGEMKPKDAAEVLKELNDDTVLTIFSKMEDGQVSKILALFEPERAARLTRNMLNGQ